MKNLICLTLSNEFNLATFIVGILSLCGVVINIIVTAKNNKNKRYTDLITHHRISTMETLKNVSSNLIKSVYSPFHEWHWFRRLYILPLYRYSLLL